MENKIIKFSFSPLGEIKDETLSWEEPLVLDVDDLEGIIQQLEAISLGYAEMFQWFEVMELDGWEGSF